MAKKFSSEVEGITFTPVEVQFGSNVVGESPEVKEAIAIKDPRTVGSGNPIIHISLEGLEEAVADLKSNSVE